MRKLFALAVLILVSLIAFSTVADLAAFAQDLAPVTDPAVSAPVESGDPSAPSDPLGGYAIYLLAVLIVVEASKRLAALIPGKKADEFEGYLGSAELLIRRLVDFLAGRTKHPEDQSAVKHE